MSPRPHRAVDPVEREIELVLNSGRFIRDRACDSFVTDLEEVAARIAALTKSAPERAVRLYEAFLTGCQEKAAEVDDSSGNFGQFVQELFCGWIEARQAAGADPDETATHLLRWMDDDRYSFTYQLERRAVQAFNLAGLGAFCKQIRRRFDAVESAAPGGSLRSNPEYLRRRWGEALRTLYLAQKDFPSYLALTEETGLSAQDCHALGTLLAGRRDDEGALAWVLRGLAISKTDPRESVACYDLGNLHRELLVRLGRGEEVLQAAWAEFREHPSNYLYARLLNFAPKEDRTAWRAKALDVAEGAELHAVLDLFVEEREFERLAAWIRRSADGALEQVSYSRAVSAAQELQKSHPDVAARLYCAQGMRVLHAKKSKYYGGALCSFAQAMRCCQRAELSAEWDRMVNKVRAEHSRKVGFMPGFERLLSGVGKRDEPSSLDSAKARLLAKHTEDQ